MDGRCGRAEASAGWFLHALPRQVVGRPRHAWLLDRSSGNHIIARLPVRQVENPGAPDRLARLRRPMSRQAGSGVAYRCVKEGKCHGEEHVGIVSLDTVGT
jgi:hypothetical protein